MVDSICTGGVYHRAGLRHITISATAPLTLAHRFPAASPGIDGKAHKARKRLRAVAVKALTLLGGRSISTRTPALAIRIPQGGCHADKTRFCIMCALRHCRGVTPLVLPRI